MTVCAMCSGDNPEHARFCLACGAPIAQDVTGSTGARKVVTVLFVDVAESTSLGERLDPESVRAILGRFFELARATVERHGGVVERFAGDAVMSVFGVPHLHEDDALRAVRAGVDLRVALDDLNEVLQVEYGMRLATRTGIFTGEVAIGVGEIFATGDAVNVAARLEQHAAPGEILLGEPTRLLVRDAVELNRIEPLSLKGKADPVQAWRVEGVVLDVPIARRLDSPIVGRARELALLQYAAELSLERGSCRLVTLFGPAGIGKSRLVRELLAGIGDRARVLSGRSLSYGAGNTLWPLAEVVREAAALDLDIDRDEALGLLAELVGDDPDASLISDRIATAIGLKAGHVAEDEVAWAVRRLFQLVGREKPLVIVFDDLHWAESIFLDLLTNVTDRIRDLALLVICMARPEFLDARPGWAGGLPNAMSVLLEPLSPAETEELILNADEVIHADAALRARVVAAAGGNPLFAEEMLHALAEGDRQLETPPTVQALLAARLDALDRDERELVASASIVGQEFRRDEVRVLAHGIDFDSVFDSLLRKDLLQPAQTGSVDVLRFKHLLIRDAAYMSLPRLRRAELHEQFAHFVERSAGGRLAEVEEIVAYHLEQAHRERTAVAPGDPDARMLAAEAGRHAHAAGARASARGDIPAAIVLLERASGLLRAGGEDDLETTFELAVALKDSGDVVRVEGLLETTLKRAVAAGDTRLEWCARLELSALAADKGLDITAEMLLDEAAQARRVFETLGDELGVARSWQRVGVVHGVAGRCELARDAFERAREHARSGGGQREERIASQPLFYCLAVGPTPAGEAIERAQELLEEVHPYLGVELVAVAAVAHLCAMQGRFDEARALLARSDAIADELGETINKLQATFYSSQVAALAGDLASAERQLRAAADYAERAGHTGYLASVAEYLAEVVHRRGDNEEAERLTRLSEASAREDDALAQIGWRVVRAKLLADRGEIDAALELGHDAVGLARRTDAPNVRGAAFLALAHVLRRADRDSDGAAAEGEAVDAFLTKGNTVQATSTREPISTSPLSNSAS